MIRIGILGAGNIAGHMGETLLGMDPGRVCRYAVAARDYERASAFARQYGFEKAYGSYEEMAQDGQVDLVYIATPHSHHYDHIRLCLDHGKHILCEKAFTANAGQAREVLRLAREKGCLLTEAIWTRYMPSRKMIDDLLASGVIGRPYMLTANLCYVVNYKERLKDPALAGGALLDVGVYPINFASMVFGDEIERVTSGAVLTDQGVDAQNSITFIYRDGKVAVLNSSMMALSDRRGVVYGDKGFLEVTNINNCEKIQVFDLDRRLTASCDVPEQITGYEYEVEACLEAIEAGLLECPQMPHQETIRIMELMDGLRREWGVVYPFER